jgi:3-hydroxyacyl-CoA dehydrogenase
MTVTNASPAPSLNPWFPPAPAGSPPLKPLRAIGIIGTSRTASGIAHWCATKTLGVILHDTEAGALTQAVEVIRGHFRAAEDRNEISHAAAHKAMGGIGITTSLEDLEFCDLVIDTLIEDAASKRARFEHINRVMPAETVLVSSASAAGLEDLVAVIQAPERLLGLQFFDPVNETPHAQVTITSRTARGPAERLLAFLATLGKRPLIQGAPRATT